MHEDRRLLQRFMDEATIEQRGCNRSQPLLKQIAAINERKSL